MVFSSQPANATSNLQHAAAAGVQPWDFDDDLALGCECANPALQIERWDQEHEDAPPRETC